MDKATQSPSAGPDCAALVGKTSDIPARPAGTAGWKLSKLEGARFEVAIPPGWNEVATVGSQQFRASDSRTSDMVSVDISVFPNQGKMPTLAALIKQEGHNVVVNNADVLEAFSGSAGHSGGGASRTATALPSDPQQRHAHRLRVQPVLRAKRLSDREQFATTDKHWHAYAQIFHSIAQTFRFSS